MWGEPALEESVLGSTAGLDLLVIALPGVQRFVAESRSTADVRAASEIVARLADHAAQRCRDACQAFGGEMVFPSESASEAATPTTPNRIVARLPPDAGPQVGLDVQQSVVKIWAEWVGEALGRSHAGRGGPETPGMPNVQWVCVPSATGDYRAQWQQAHDVLASRRRVRDFDFSERPDWKARKLCTLSPRWPAEEAPPGLPLHEQATLSAANWVKRRWDHVGAAGRTAKETGRGFPSTSSIASAPFRQAVLSHLGDPSVLAAVRDLMNAARNVTKVREAVVSGLMVPAADPGDWFATSGGPWVYRGQWQAEALAKETGRQAAEIEPAIRPGIEATGRLQEVMKDDYGVPAPAAYLAVVAQDLDSMGRFLSGQSPNADRVELDVTAAEHQRVSGELRQLAGRQRDALTDNPALLAVPVYAGGDDLLFFAPAANALTAARACHDKIPHILPTASTAVLFFHFQAGLQMAMSRVRLLLDDAKDHVKDKHALAVGYMRRSGVAEFSIQPWIGMDGASATDLFALFAVGHEHPISPRLVTDLERDADELGRLSRQEARFYEAELGRLVRRHIGGDPKTAVGAAAAAAAAMSWLGRNEAADHPSGDARSSRPEIAARVGVFLRQEAR
jgi:CRISPR-associated protein